MVCFCCYVRCVRVCISAVMPSVVGQDENDTFSLTTEKNQTVAFKQIFSYVCIEYNQNRYRVCNEEFGILMKATQKLDNSKKNTKTKYAQYIEEESGIVFCEVELSSAEEGQGKSQRKRSIKTKL